MSSSILDKFKSAVNSFFSVVVDQIEKFAYAFLPKAGALAEASLESVAAIAGAAVLDQATKVLDGQIKFDNAVNTVVDTVKSNGQTIAVNTAKAAVQLAFLEAQKIAQGK